MKKIFLKFSLVMILTFVFKFNIGAETKYGVYNQGVKITYQNIEFYVLNDSDENTSVVTLMKAEPLTVDEINKYGTGHINRYTKNFNGTIYNQNGYGALTYYSSETCGYVNNTEISTDCKFDYVSSDVKYVVDNWAKNNLTESDLVRDQTGYKYRLITKQEILDYMNYTLVSEQDFSYNPIKNKTPSWFYNSKYSYWIMDSINKKNSYGEDVIGTLYINENGKLTHNKDIYNYLYTVRPVITIKKKSLEKNDIKTSESSNINKNSNTNNSNILITNTEENLIVDVPDTLVKTSIIIITIGICLIIIGIIVSVKVKKR